MRILLVEDEQRVAAFVQQGLEEEGYEVERVIQGNRAVERALQDHFDLVLLDLRLPDLSGIEVCRHIRMHDTVTPILMLTALDSVEDKVTGLRAGADDYLPKPFAFDELLARMEAVLRRTRIQETDTAYHDGSLELDPVSRTCTFEGRPLALTQKEYDLLAFFLARQGQAVNREIIHRGVWGCDFDRGTNLIDVYVGYVRRKLQESGCSSTIETVRGVGYRYVSGADSGFGHDPRLKTSSS